MRDNDSDCFNIFDKENLPCTLMLIGILSGMLFSLYMISVSISDLNKQKSDLREFLLNPEMSQEKFVDYYSLPYKVSQNNTTRNEDLCFSNREINGTEEPCYVNIKHIMLADKIKLAEMGVDLSSTHTFKNKSPKSVSTTLQDNHGTININYIK